MINLTLNDATQLTILPHLERTEELLNKAIKSLGGKSDVEVIAMPDLGLSNNATRMRGGFFTGMYLNWHSDIPFVPVDTTINSCGVYIFTLKRLLEKEEFSKLLGQAKDNIGSLNYSWNFDRGNHFITMGAFANGTPCVIMHASANEYKKDDPDKALYPAENNWYYNQIKCFSDEKSDGRFLRYIVGDTAEKFIETATSLSEINKRRFQEIAYFIFGDLVNQEYLYVPHYGMPTRTSVAIGCSWMDGKYALLTAPRKNIFIVSPTKKGSNKTINGYMLNPHGLGVEWDNPTITYADKSIFLNSEKVSDENVFLYLKGKKIRMMDASDVDIFDYASKIFKTCPGDIIETITPIASLSNYGII